MGCCGRIPLCGNCPHFATDLTLVEAVHVRQHHSWSLLTLFSYYVCFNIYRWKWIFNRSVFSAIQPVWTTVYYAILLVLVVLFIGKRIILCLHITIIMCLIWFELCVRLYPYHEEVWERAP